MAHYPPSTQLSAGAGIFVPMSSSNKSAINQNQSFEHSGRNNKNSTNSSFGGKGGKGKGGRKNSSNKQKSNKQTKTKTAADLEAEEEAAAIAAVAAAIQAEAENNIFAQSSGGGGGGGGGGGSGGLSTCMGDYVLTDDVQHHGSASKRKNKKRTEYQQSHTLDPSLLNFSFAPLERSASSLSSSAASTQRRYKPATNSVQKVSANSVAQLKHHFVLSPNDHVSNGHISLNKYKNLDNVDPDESIDWDEVALVLVSIDDECDSKCPISLEPLIATDKQSSEEKTYNRESALYHARKSSSIPALLTPNPPTFITKCGHLFSAVSLVKYMLNAAEREQQCKCPCCSDQIHFGDLKMALVSMRKYPTVVASTTTPSPMNAPMSSCASFRLLYKLHSSITAPPFTFDSYTESHEQPYQQQQQQRQYREQMSPDGVFPLISDDDMLFSRVSIGFPSTIIGFLELAIDEMVKLKEDYVSCGELNYIQPVEFALSMYQEWRSEWLKKQTNEQQQQRSMKVEHVVKSSSESGVVGMPSKKSGNLNNDKKDLSANSSTSQESQPVLFYQLEDGQRCFLHNVNMQCLLDEYLNKEHVKKFKGVNASAEVVGEEVATGGQGSVVSSTSAHTADTSANVGANREGAPCLPCTIEGEVLEVEKLKVTAELRRRCAFLKHLPVGCEIAFVEIDLSKVVSPETLQKHRASLDERKKKREKVIRKENQERQKVKLEEKKKQEEIRRLNQSRAPPSIHDFDLDLYGMNLSDLDESDGINGGGGVGGVANLSRGLSESSSCSSGSKMGPSNSDFSPPLNSQSVSFSFANVTKMELNQNTNHFPTLGGVTAPPPPRTVEATTPITSTNAAATASSAATTTSGTDKSKNVTENVTVKKKNKKGDKSRGVPLFSTASQGGTAYGHR